MVLKKHLTCTILALRGSRGGREGGNYASAAFWRWKACRFSRGGGKHATLAVKVEKPTFRSGMEAAHTKNPVT